MNINYNYYFYHLLKVTIFFIRKRVQGSHNIMVDGSVLKLNCVDNIMTD